MKKSSLHFKIASWSCRYPWIFYSISLLVLFLFIAIGVFSTQRSPLGGMGSVFPERAMTTKIELSDTANWTPIKDMDIPGGIKCRLYKNADTSITNCYKLVDGVWSFDQSF